MEISQFIISALFVITGLLFIWIGSIYANPEKYKKFIEWNNQLRGFKTNITPLTIAYGKFIGIVLMIIGIALIIGSVFMYSLLENPTGIPQ